MKKDILSQIWMIFLFLLLIGFLFWGIFYVDNLQSKISILGIVAIIVAAFTSVLTVSINNKKAKEREYELHILKEKQKVFEHFYNSYFEMLFKIKKGQSGLSLKAEEEMLLFKKGLMNWGSDKLIKKYLHIPYCQRVPGEHCQRVQKSIVLYSIPELRAGITSKSLEIL